MAAFGQGTPQACEDTAGRGPDGRGGEVAGMVMLESSPRIVAQTRSAGTAESSSGGDAASAADVFEIEEDETYSNYRYKIIFYIMRDSLPGMETMVLDRQALDGSGIGKSHAPIRARNFIDLNNISNIYAIL